MKLVNKDLAIALQSLGYEGEYSAWIDRDNGAIENDSSLLYDWHIPCPRLDDAAYWLRDKHNQLINIIHSRFGWVYDLRIIPVGHYINPQGRYPDYDSALEAAVTRAIELTKHKQQ